MRAWLAIVAGLAVGGGVAWWLSRDEADGSEALREVGGKGALPWKRALRCTAGVTTPLS